MRHLSAAEVTKKNLMDAFWRLYCRKGLAGVTVKEIAQLAGYNRSTFYEYFTGVQDVLRALEEALLPPGPLHELQVRFLTTDMPLDAMLLEFLALIGDGLPRFCTLLGADAAFRERCGALWRPCFTARLERDNGLAPQQADAAAEFLVCGMLGMLQRAYEQHADLPEARLHALLAECCGELPFAQAFGHSA